MDALVARRSIYDFLALIYRKEVDEQLLAGIRESRLLEALGEQGYDLRADLTSSYDPNLIRRLAAEYARLFLGPGPHLPLYESVHNPRDPKRGRLWGDTTVQFKRTVEFYGLRFEGKGYHGIPDHLSNELEFMSRLIGKEIEHRKKGELELAEKCRNIQRTFFKRHLSGWVPLLCEKIEAASGGTFYRQIAALTRDFIGSEEDSLSLEDSEVLSGSEARPKDGQATGEPF